MRLRNVKNKKEIIKNSEYIIEYPKDYIGKWKKIFHNTESELYIEIGMGKGDFIINNALKYPNINFIGIERNDSVIARALEKIPKCLNNLKIIKIDAKEIEEVFNREVDLIYLNFSDPWPKKRHSNRRLTSSMFLNKYDSMFNGDKQIIQKTDNNNLFEYSIESLSKHGYIIEKVSLDLHSSDMEDNIMTEYEEKFVNKGQKINYLHAKKCK